MGIRGKAWQSRASEGPSSGSVMGSPQDQVSGTWVCLVGMKPDLETGRLPGVCSRAPVTECRLSAQTASRCYIAGERPEASSPRMAVEKLQPCPLETHQT